MNRSLAEDDVREIFANPFYAINISPVLAAEHELMVSEETWVKVNLKIMQEIGQEEWLKHLLKALKSKSRPTEFSDGQAEKL